MIHYLRRKKASTITAQLVMAALERNFNGCEEFDTICEQFIRHVSGTVSYRDKSSCMWL